MKKKRYSGSCTEFEISPGFNSLQVYLLVLCSQTKYVISSGLSFPSVVMG